jgi:hypothetical protein
MGCIALRRTAGTFCRDLRCSDLNGLLFIPRQSSGQSEGTTHVSQLDHSSNHPDHWLSDQDHLPDWYRGSAPDVVPFARRVRQLVGL